MGTEQSALSYRIVDDNRTYVACASFVTGLYGIPLARELLRTISVYTLEWSTPKVAPPRKPRRNSLSSNEEGANTDLLTAILPCG